MAREARRRRAPVIIPARFNGPPRSANGGWVAGAVAAAVDTDGPVQVRLLASPPLDTELDVIATDAGADLVHGGDVLVSAAATDVISDPPAAVDPDTATTARRRFQDAGVHPFTTCFVCGTARRDGLHVFPGPVEGDDWSHVATTFSTTEFATASELPWAALDCPSGWAAGLATDPALLASYTVRVLGAPQSGEPCVLVGRDDGPRGTSGRARASRSAFFGSDGRLLAHADAVWVVPKAG